MSPGERAGRFAVDRSSGSAHDFHHRSLEVSDGAAIWIHRVVRPTIVVGSSQSTDIVDVDAAAAAGWDVSGRRSGGGVVVVHPDDSCWIDVVISRHDQRWSDDVNRAFDWIGRWWRDALALAGVHGSSVHAGGIVDREHGRAVCFAGLGPGEVVVADTDVDRKVVGLSQRRTRDAARFQGLYLRRWDPSPIRRFVDPAAIPADLDLDAVAAGLADGPAPEDVVAAFLRVAPA